jgi:hypothetical protein
MAPSTPPPPSSEVFAALTIASTRRRVMSPEDKRMRAAMSGKTVMAQRRPRVEKYRKRASPRLRQCFGRNTRGAETL